MEEWPGRHLLPGLEWVGVGAVPVGEWITMSRNQRLLVAAALACLVTAVAANGYEFSRAAGWSIDWPVSVTAVPGFYGPNTPGTRLQLTWSDSVWGAVSDYIQSDDHSIPDGDVGEVFDVEGLFAKQQGRKLHILVVLSTPESIVDVSTYDPAYRRGTYVMAGDLALNRGAAAAPEDGPARSYAYTAELGIKTAGPHAGHAERYARWGYGSQGPTADPSADWRDPAVDQGENPKGYAPGEQVGEFTGYPWASNFWHGTGSEFSGIVRVSDWRLVLTGSDDPSDAAPANNTYAYEVVIDTGDVAHAITDIMVAASCLNDGLALTLDEGGSPGGGGGGGGALAALPLPALGGLLPWEGAAAAPVMAGGVVDEVLDESDEQVLPEENIPDDEPPPNPPRGGGDDDPVATPEPVVLSLLFAAAGAGLAANRTRRGRGARRG